MARAAASSVSVSCSSTTSGFPTVRSPTTWWKNTAAMGARRPVAVGYKREWRRRRWWSGEGVGSCRECFCCLFPSINKEEDSLPPLSPRICFFSRRRTRRKEDDRRILRLTAILSRHNMNKLEAFFLSKAKAQ
jgi:hypothetical protein